jgi:hypothetical protein
MLIAFDSNSMFDNPIFLFLLTVNLLLQTKYLEQDSFLTFCSLKFNSVVRSCLFLCYCIHLIFIALYDKNIVDGVQLPTKLLAVFLLICLSFVISVSISTRSKHTRTNHWCKIHV